MSIQFSGIGSGLDYNTWVEQLVSAKKATSVTGLETKKAQLDKQSSALSTIKTSYTSLQSALKTFTNAISGTTSDIWAKTSITSSADDFLTATSTSGLATGDISVSVQQLATSTVAQSAKNPAQLISEETKYSDIGNNDAKGGSFSIYVDNKRYEIQIDKGADTLGTIAKKISDATGGKVSGKVNDDGTFEISANNGEKILLGAGSDTSNFKSIMKLTQDTEGGVKSAYALTSFKTNLALSDSNNGLKEAVTNGKIKINGVEFEIDEKTSLKDLITKINSNEQAKVSAKYDTISNKLILTSKETGEFNIALEQEDTNFFDVFGLTQDGALVEGSQTLGKNAILTVNGNKIVSSSNTVTSESTGITGLTLNLKKVTDGSDEKNTTEVNLNVQNDTKDVKEALKGFVNAYNNVIEQIREATAADGYLEMDMSLRNIQNELRSITTGYVQNEGSFGLLSQIGISTGKAGLDVSSSAYTLTFDEAAFDEAFAKDSESVKNLVSGGRSGNGEGIFDKLISKVDNKLDPTNGLFVTKSESITKLINLQEDRITKAYEALDNYEAQLMSKFQAMDEMIAKMQQQYSSFIG